MGKVGSIIGLVGGVIILAGFFLPWLVVSSNLGGLLSGLGTIAGSLLGGTPPPILSQGGVINGVQFLSGLSDLQSAFDSIRTLATQAGIELGPWTAAISGLSWIAILVLLLALLVIVFSATNLATGRFRGGVIGTGTAAMVLSLILIVVIHQANSLLQQQIGGRAGGLLGTIISQISISISAGPGLYVSIAGGVLGVAGGVMGRKREKKPEASPAEATPAPVAEEKK